MSLPSPAPDAVRRMVAFVRAQQIALGVGVDPEMSRRIDIIVAPGSERGALFNVMRSMPNPEKRPDDQTPARALAMLTYRSAKYLLHYDETPGRGSVGTRARYYEMEGSAATALWRAKFGGFQTEGSGRICAAAVRASLAGTEVP